MTRKTSLLDAPLNSQGVRNLGGSQRIRQPKSALPPCPHPKTDTVIIGERYYDDDIYTSPVYARECALCGKIL